jgi:hypothetical protein
MLPLVTEVRLRNQNRGESKLIYNGIFVSQAILIADFGTL